MLRRKPESRIRVFEREALPHLDALLATAIRMAGSRQDAEEVVQEAYLRAWKYFDSFETGSNCRAWLFSIMFNVINSGRSKQAKRAEVPLEDEENTNYQPSNVVMFDPLKQIEHREALEATSQLSEEYRSVLWLVVIEEFSYKEAAEILSVPIGTVMSRLHRARRELRKILMAQQATPRAVEI